jgi:predicted nucleic acid-binding protein
MQSDGEPGAARGGAKILLSADLPAGRMIAGVRIVNLFPGSTKD